MKRTIALIKDEALRQKHKALHYAKDCTKSIDERNKWAFRAVIADLALYQIEAESERVEKEISNMFL